MGNQEPGGAKACDPPWGDNLHQAWGTGRASEHTDDFGEDLG